MKTPRRLLFGDDARSQLLKGAERLAKAAGITYGPCGRIVILQRLSGNLATKDGATVVRELTFPDPGENLGAAVIKQSALAMSDSVGDGTTTATILANAILQECGRLIIAGCDPKQLTLGLQDALESAQEVLKEIAMPVESETEVRAVAWVASNGDTEVSDVLTRAIMGVGEKGTVIVEDGYGLDLELIIREGMPLDTGLGSVSHYYFTGEDLKEVASQPLIALVDCDLHSFNDSRDILETATQWPHNPLLLFALSIEGGALQPLVSSKIRGTFQFYPLKVPGWGDHRRGLLDDLAALTGATVIDPKAGMDLTKIDAEWFGSVQTATIESKTVTLVGYNDGKTTERVQGRIKVLERELERSTHDYDRDRIQERIAKLVGGLGVIRVGGSTEATMKERRARIEDALGSVKVALERGIVPGGGTAYLFVSEFLHAQGYQPGDLGFGQRAFVQALQVPFRVLASNAGKDPSQVLMRVEHKRDQSEFDPWIGWDALEDKVRLLHQDPMIIDAAGVSIDALKYAVSAASTLILTEAMVTKVST